MLPSIWYAQATEGLYLLTAVRGQHLNLRLVTQNFQEPKTVDRYRIEPISQPRVDRKADRSAGLCLPLRAVEQAADAA